MEKIYIIGDMHTVSAFRLAGVEGMVSTAGNALVRLEEIIKKRDAGIVLMTNDLASALQERIREINLNKQNPVVIEIPGMDDIGGLRMSAMNYISEALGIRL